MRSEIVQALPEYPDLIAENNCPTFLAPTMMGLTRQLTTWQSAHKIPPTIEVAGCTNFSPGSRLQLNEFYTGDRYGVIMMKRGETGGNVHFHPVPLLHSFADFDFFMEDTEALFYTVKDNRKTVGVLTKEWEDIPIKEGTYVELGVKRLSLKRMLFVHLLEILTGFKYRQFRLQAILSMIRNSKVHLSIGNLDTDILYRYC